MVLIVMFSKQRKCFMFAKVFFLALGFHMPTFPHFPHVGWFSHVNISHSTIITWQAGFLMSTFHIVPSFLRQSKLVFTCSYHSQVDWFSHVNIPHFPVIPMYAGFHISIFHIFPSFPGRLEPEESLLSHLADRQRDPPDGSLLQGWH